MEIRLITRISEKLALAKRCERFDKEISLQLATQVLTDAN